jgi:predicted esterase
MRFAGVSALLPLFVLTTLGCASANDAPASSRSETFGTSLDDVDEPAPPTEGPSLAANAPDQAPVAPSEPPEKADKPAPPASDPGPPPTSACTVEKNDAGFFWRTSPKSAYVAYVPASYDPASPMRVIVGMHGCGDTAENFATWGINPWATRATQAHIGISVSGETGNNRCWSKGNDDDKVLAAVDDLAKCFWLDRSKVVVAGFSSGGELAYRVGLLHADSFAGILVENSALYAAGAPTSALLGGAAWKLNVAHRAHTSDSVFPIAQVKADWAAMTSAGFPLVSSEIAGTHDGTSDDWANWLIPQSAGWTRPAKP